MVLQVVDNFIDLAAIILSISVYGLLFEEHWSEDMLRYHMKDRGQS